jgi:hypothetical protein
MMNDSAARRSQSRTTDWTQKETFMSHQDSKAQRSGCFSILRVLESWPQQLARIVGDAELVVQPLQAPFGRAHVVVDQHQ